MNMPDAEIAAALAEYDHTVATMPGASAAWEALQKLARALMGARLFTVMTVDMEKGIAGRVYSSDPMAYPVSGTKPIHYDDWFDVVHRQRKPFVANTIADIAKVFPDHGLIASLGCGSVVNLPIEIGGDLVGTVNLLDAEHHYDAERLGRLAHLRLPAKLSYLLSR
jgi:hypothetical protein